MKHLNLYVPIGMLFIGLLVFFGLSMHFWQTLAAVFFGATLAHLFYDYHTARGNGEEFSPEGGRSNCCRHCLEEER
ncbi:MAG: hypothetical protein ACE10O_09185, partial [Candidatus Acidiferrales bacterium]